MEPRLKGQVMIVDDHASIRHTLRSVFEAADMESPTQRMVLRESRRLKRYDLV
jgi:hypothetical protein